MSWMRSLPPMKQRCERPQSVTRGSPPHLLYRLQPGSKRDGDYARNNATNYVILQLDCDQVPAALIHLCLYILFASTIIVFVAHIHDPFVVHNCLLVPGCILSGCIFQAQQARE